jgi:hypothetical protein
VNQSNFAEVMFLLFFGCKGTEYNSHCFSTKDIQFEMWGMSKAQDAIDAMRTSGYDPVLLYPILKHESIGYDYGLPADLTLKQELDDQFSIEVDNQLYELGCTYYAQQKSAIS